MSIDKMKEYLCDNIDCCRYRIVPYEYEHVPYVISTKKLKKAGSFVYDSSKQKILLVQSRGQMWGPPKGSIQQDEKPLHCALREVKEETGIELNEQQFSGSVVIKSKALYYITDMNITEKEWNIYPQCHVQDNDANGIGWFHIGCLENWIRRGLSINQHTYILLKKILNVSISSPILSSMKSDEDKDDKDDKVEDLPSITSSS